MVLIQIAFPRSGATFLVHLLTTGISGSDYKKIPRDFVDEQGLQGFLDMRSGKPTVTILGHNHLYNFVEFRAIRAFTLPAVFLFRDPMECISSLLALLESKPKSAGRNLFTLRRVLPLVGRYCSIVQTALILRLLRHKVYCIDFCDITVRPGQTMAFLSEQLGCPIGFEPSTVEGYKSSAFHTSSNTRPRPKDEGRGFTPYLSYLQKTCILLLAAPHYWFFRTFLRDRI